MKKDSSNNKQEANESFELQSINPSSRITKVINDINEDENVSGKALYIWLGEKTHIAHCFERILNTNGKAINETFSR